MNSLSESVDMLLHDHKKIIHTTDGFEVHDRAGLLELLHDAVFGGMETTGGSGTKARLPISEAALDLHELIDQQIAEAWADATKRVPGLSTPRQMLAEWSTLVREDTIVVVTYPEQHDRWDPRIRAEVPVVIRVRQEHTPEKLAHHWVNLIEGFFDPERTAGIKAPCIACGASKVSRLKDGEHVMSDALVFRRDRDTGRTLDARCLNCGTVWAPSQFEFLAQTLGVILDVTIPDDAPVRAPREVASEECAGGEHGECVSVWCRCEHHIERALVPVGAVVARTGGGPGVMTESVGHIAPLTRPVCGSCWTEQSVTGGCMCP